MKRVVITGMGAITPLGNDVNTYWQNVLSGTVGLKKISKFDAEDTGITLAGEVTEFDPSDYLSKKETKRMDLFSQYGVVAAGQALKNSGLDLETIDPKRLGVIVGSGIGGMTTLQDQTLVMDKKSPQRVSPFFVPMVIANMASANISIKFNAKGTSQTIVTACASATNAIGEAFHSIKYGLNDIMITGGTEATICRIGISGFAALNALSTATDPQRASIPFDQERTGFVMGEGAGMLILEELEHAKKRGAHILGEIVGYGSNCDASHMTSPLVDGSGAADAMLEALQEANITPEKIDYINAHGTSTYANDSAETTAIKKAFGEELATSIPISSTKSMIGHLLGAAGAVEAIVCVKAMEESFAPPTANLEIPATECDLDYIPKVGRPLEINYSISNSFGFGGHNAVLCLKKWS